jgi:Sugar (and other) transporter
MSNLRFLITGATGATGGAGRAHARAQIRQPVPIYAAVYHIELTRALLYTFIVAGTGVTARILAFFRVDRIGRKPLIVIGYLSAGCAALMFPRRLAIGQDAASDGGFRQRARDRAQERHHKQRSCTDRQASN